MIFSERYKELIIQEDGQFKDNICGEIDYQVKIKIADLMRHFAEPQIIQPNRYDNYEVTTTALEMAVSIFNDKKGIPYIQLNSTEPFMPGYDSLSAAFTPFLFDVIELQYEELSNKERPEFQQTLNSLFDEHNIPWLLHDGKMIKIDAQQFELNLKNKAIEEMKLLKDDEPIFQAAYDEFMQAFENYTGEKYSEVILYSEKAYESVMKVAFGLNDDTADKLCSELSAKCGDMPSSITSKGFKDNVLMALPYIRNKTSSHGAGATPIKISKNMANLALNLGCSLISFVIGEYKQKILHEKNKTE